METCHTSLFANSLELENMLESARYSAPSFHLTNPCERPILLLFHFTGQENEDSGQIMCS